MIFLWLYWSHFPTIISYKSYISYHLSAAIFSIKLFILAIIALVSLSSPASMQQLSNICLTIILAVLESTFLYSFNFMIRGSLELN